MVPSTGRLMIAILGGLPEVERDLIRMCMAESLQRHTEWPPTLTPRQQASAGSAGPISSLLNRTHMNETTHCPRP
jgi:hypothetical protein